MTIKKIQELGFFFWSLNEMTIKNRFQTVANYWTRRRHPFQRRFPTPNSAIKTTKY